MKRRLGLCGVAALTMVLATVANAQTGAPPAKSPANPATAPARSAQSGSTESKGAAYVGPITTQWGAKVTPENAWRSYPRPQMVRRDWLNLNGQWEYAITPASHPRPARMDGKILVPFAVESKLSGVARKLLPEDRLWYRRTFTVPANWSGKRTLLHFGAVDFKSVVWVNGAIAGSHVGGSDPFSFDVTPFLKPGANEIVVQVEDPTSTGDQPRGKQTLEPRSIWYTAVSGIWQTVWLEPVPELHIEEVRAVPDIDAGTLGVDVLLSSGSQPSDAVRVTALEKGKVIASTIARGNRRATLAIPGAHLWTPDDPHLYDLKVDLVGVTPPGTGEPRKGPTPMTRAEIDAYAGATVTGAVRDSVESYFGMRKISAGPHPTTGKPTLLLNNKPLFQNGVLDQGWWPESLLTPPSEEAAASDIVWLKKAGFNMLRKHIKVEPAQYYAAADRLGMLIWQDMPSGAFGDQSVRHNSEFQASFSSTAMAEYQSEFARMIGALRNFPSIVMWVTNNEGWGQYDAKTVGGIAKNMDPSRLVNTASGWLDVADSGADVYDIHTYDEVPVAPQPHGNRVLVVGEYGGVGLPVPEHLWFTDRDARIYQFAKDKDDYRTRYTRKFEEIVRQAKELGIAAAVYTQTSDVEGEVNGLLTYDRAVEKLPAAEFRTMAAPLFDTKK